ncbi:MAG: acetyl ornithine aminotransferase family protein [Candidatus Limnocylindrales bacterium]
MTQVVERGSSPRQVPHIVTELPGPKARAHIAFDETVTSPSLPRAYPIVPVRGDGLVVEDIDGNVFLDFAAGIAVTSTGHSHPDIVDAITRQAADLIHFSASDFYLPIYAHTAAELDRIAPMRGPTRVFMGNSGAEAIEAAIKLARFATGRQYLLAFIGGFHGRTYGAVSLTASKAKYHAGFGPLLPGVVHVPFGSAGLDELEQRVFKKLVPAKEFAAVVVEPIQGEGGYVVPDDAFLPRLRQICDEHGILFVADEVQSGAGRTGKMWAIEHWGVEPDIVCLAKGIASGLPLGAFIARAEQMNWPPGSHGSTFGGNPVACAVGLATLDLLEDGLMENAARVGAVLQDGLREIAATRPQVTDVRGLGLMLALELKTPELATHLVQAAFERGLLLLTAGARAVRISPPLLLDAEEAATGLEIIAAALDS